MAATWPAGVDDGIEVQGFSETLPNAVLRSAMDVGAAKQRRRFSAAAYPVAGSIMIPTDQVAIFKAWFEDTLGMGALRFDWAHPRTGALLTWRFIGNQPPKITPVSSTWWRISMQLEVLP